MEESPRAEMQELLVELQAARDGQPYVPSTDEQNARCRSVELPEWLSPLMGWPLRIVLWLALGINLAEIITSLLEGQDGIFILGAPIPPVWSFPLLHASPITCIIGVIALLCYRHWGYGVYLAAIFLFLLFCTIPEFNAVKFGAQMTVFAVMSYLLYQKRGEFV